MNDKNKELTLLGNTSTEYPADYSPGILEAFENKHTDIDYLVRFNCPEFTCLCPITGQPDFAAIYFNYIPDRLMVESKSLKIYLFSFRFCQVKLFQERHFGAATGVGAGSGARPIVSDGFGAFFVGGIEMTGLCIRHFQQFAGVVFHIKRQTVGYFDAVFFAKEGNVFFFQEIETLFAIQFFELCTRKNDFFAVFLRKFKAAFFDDMRYGVDVVSVTAAP